MMIIELAIYSYLALMVGYIFFFSLSGRLLGTKKQGLKTTSSYKKIAILVPVYKEDDIIYATARSYTELDYPAWAYDTYIIADSLQEQTLQQLSGLPVHVIPVKFDKSTKTKSLNRAFSVIPDEYDIALICDADNVLQKNYLHKINIAFQEGAQAVQGQRVAKNMDTPFAILDSASELINNHIFRKGANAIGISSSVIGSGMAFRFDIIKNALLQINAVGGFDKVLQLLIVEKNIRIKYLENALVFDEKISHAEAFGHQRRRWLSSQFLYCKKYFLSGSRMLFKGNFDYFNLAVMHNIILPRVILLALLPVVAIAATLLKDHLFIAPVYWWILVAAYLFSLLIALPLAFFRMDILRALLSMPKAMMVMAGAVLRLKGANNTFIHTRHHYQDINNPLFKDESR